MSTTTDKERARLAALRSYNVLDTPREKIFESVVQLAASMSGTPTALISFVDGNRQWFKASVGLDAQETARDISFCTHAIESEGLFIVPDATLDERFATNPLVTAGPMIRSYAGAPLITLEGHVLGTLCVIDYEPRDFSPEEQQALRDLSLYVMAQLELRKRFTRANNGGATQRSMTRAIVAALENDEFRLHYQPTTSVATGKIERLEALLRWQSHDRGLVPAAQLLPLLESSGLIVEVGRWVLHQAAQDYRGWLRQGLHVPRISINLSALQLQHPDVVAMLAATVRAPGEPPMFMDIEMQESTLRQATAEVIARLYDIQQFGVDIVIDDFGSTPDALRHLARFPMDAVKLDRACAAVATSAQDNIQRVADIVKEAHSHGLQVIAKGVEAEQQLDMMRKLQCDQIQGHLLAAPAPAALVARKLGRVTLLS